MQKSRENPEQEETIQKLQEKTKKVIFKVNNHLLKHLNSFSEYLYYLLILIETLQILWFSIHPTFNFISKSIGIQQLQLSIRYFSLEYYLRQNPGSWRILIIIVFSIIMIHLITLIITGYLLHRNAISQVGQLFAKISNFQILLVNTLLTGPFFNVVAVTLYCDTNSPYHFGQVCYDTQGIAYCIIACVVALVLIIEGGLYAFLYYLKNPFSRGCLSAPSNIYYIGKFCLKILPCLYFLIDYELKYVDVYIFAYVIVFAGYLFLFRMWSYHTFNQKYYYFVYSCEIILTWIGLVNILQYYLSSSQRPNLNLIFCLIGTIPICFTFLKLQKESKKKIFLEGIRNLKKNKDVAEEFIYMLISLIETSSNYQNKIQFLGYMKIHNNGCQTQNSKCNCHEFFENFYLKKKINPNEETLVFYEFLKNILLDYIKKYSGHVMFKIIYSYLLYYKLDSKIQSVYHITETSKEKLSFAEDFLVYRLKLLFEQQNDEKENDLSQDKGHAIKIYLEFNNLFMNLESEIQLCSKNHLEYWRELKEDFPSILKLWNLSKHFEMEIKKISSIFLKISQIYSNNLLTLILYSNFLKYIVLDTKQYRKLRQKIKSEKFSSESNTKDINDMKFRENSNLCTVTITTHMNNIGIILNANSELQKILGYTKSEIIGQKITKIMPKLYYQLHDGFVIKYLNRSDKEIQSKQFTVFALCKKGFLIECNILTKLIPQIQNGFHLVGFIKKVEQTSRYLPHYIMYDGDSNNIEAISQSCVNSLGLTSDNIDKSGNASQITINYLFPQVDFDQLDNRPELKLEGFETLIDTKVLSDDFVPYDSFSADSETDYYKNGKMNSKVYLIKESVYGKLKIKFIKFFLLNQDDDQPKQTMKNQNQNDIENQKSSYRENQQNSTQEQQSSHDIKKFHSFISQSSIKCILTLLIVSIYLFMGIEISLMSFDVSRNIIDSNQVSFSFQVLNESNTILNCLNNANFDTKKLKLTNKLDLSRDNFTRYQKHMRESAEYMQNAIVDYVRTSVILQDSFHYSQPKTYSTYYFYNNQDPPIQQSFQYNDALFQYITTIIAFSSYKYESLDLPKVTNSTILGNFYFVQKNGMSTIFFATIMNQVNIFAFFKDRFKYYLKSRELLLGLRVMSIGIVFCLILPIIVKLNKVNGRLLGVYKMIPISDIRIIEEGSVRREEKEEGEKDGEGGNQNSGFKDYEGDEINFDQKGKIGNKSSFLPLMSNNFSPSQSSPLSTFRPPETSDALLISIDQQKQTLKRNSLSKDLMQQRRKIPKVKLSSIPSNRNQILFFIFIITVLLGYCIGQYYIHFYFFSPLQVSNDTMNYYKTALSTNRQTFLNAQEYFSGEGDVAIVNFKRSYDLLYWNLQALYAIEKDFNKNREIVYGSIEELKSLFNAPDIDTMKTAKFQRIEANVDQVEINLINESNNFILETQSRIKDSFQRVCYVKFAVEFVVLLVIMKVLFSGYLEKVKVRTYRSISMAKMIPIKIVMKNPEILKMLE